MKTGAINFTLPSSSCWSGTHPAGGLPWDGCLEAARGCVEEAKRMGPWSRSLGRRATGLPSGSVDPWIPRRGNRSSLGSRETFPLSDYDVGSSTRFVTLHYTTALVGVRSGARRDFRLERRSPFCPWALRETVVCLPMNPWETRHCSSNLIYPVPSRSFPLGSLFTCTTINHPFSPPPPAKTRLVFLAT